MAKDFYQTLGVDRGASADDIKKAYRRLSKELHPDKHKGDKAAEQKFKDVNEAYEVLSNPQKRQSYDQFGSAGPGGAGFGGGQGGFGGFDFSGGDRVDFSDLFESFFGGGGGQRGGGRRERRGEHREVRVTVDFMEAVTGVEKTIRLKRLAPCGRCSGKGAEPGSSLSTCGECSGTGQVMRTAQSIFGTIQQAAVCPRCAGSGKVPEKPCRDCTGEGRLQNTEDVTVQVPAGIDSGQTLRLRGYGDAGPRGSEPGDLYVHVEVREDSRFTRDGTDIRVRLPLAAVDAMLGTEADVETVLGSVRLTIPAGTQPGQVFRIRGKGMPVLNGSGHGDHYVTADVEIPEKLTRKERELLEEWRKMRG